jgi:hypothetical protein
MHHDKPQSKNSITQYTIDKCQKSDLYKPSFLVIKWHRRLLPDVLGVVDDDVDPVSPRPDHSLPITVVVLHLNEVLAKLEPLDIFCLDRSVVERLSCSWDLLSQLIERVLLEILLDVILSLSFPVSVLYETC